MKTTSVAAAAHLDDRQPVTQVSSLNVFLKLQGRKTEDAINQSLS